VLALSTGIGVLVFGAGDDSRKVHPNGRYRRLGALDTMKLVLWTHPPAAGLAAGSV